MDLGNLPDVIKREVIDFDRIPDRAKEVLALRMVGMGAQKIAKVLKIGKTTVEQYLKQYDPDNVCAVGQETKRKLTSEMLMTTGIRALLEISDAKLRRSDAKELAAISGRCISTAEKIRALDKGLKIKETSRIESMMDSLETAQVVEE